MHREKKLAKQFGRRKEKKGGSRERKEEKAGTVDKRTGVNDVYHEKKEKERKRKVKIEKIDGGRENGRGKIGEEESVYIEDIK